MNLLARKGLPLGFGMALSQNVDAMKTFTMLSEPEQQKVLDKTHAAATKTEMQEIVDGLARGKRSF